MHGVSENVEAPSIRDPHVRLESPRFKFNVDLNWRCVVGMIGDVNGGSPSISSVLPE